ncbi:MAG TPA: SGNH/GDSL hydrolase family protein [Ramlibacter sp.]|nr:SGNH/GDSL hydrolase family protein [Ramlibacter sp.]
MAFQRLRRALLAVTCASAALLAACGGGTVVSQFGPSRIVVFGDGFGDLGQVASRRYTVNDGTTNVWSAQVAAQYGVGLTAAAAGGASYATGNARITAQPDAAGASGTPTVQQQIDTFLAGGVGSGDLLMISAGLSDIVTQARAVELGTQARAAAVANIETAARDLGAQVRRLVSAGASHVVVVGPYNLERSPWAIESARTTELQEYSAKFNEALLISIVDLGAKVLYVDAALHYNLVTATPASYGLTNGTAAVCISTDAGAGIGIGAGKVNSALCNTGTLVPGASAESYVFADSIYPTPVAHRLFGDYAVARIRARW